MKKAALLTFHRSLNYGAVMQTYATCRLLNELGCRVELIDLRIKERLGGVHRTLGVLKQLRISRFRHRNYPPETIRYKNIDEIRKYPPAADVYIVGSDQTWNPEITGHLREAFMLGFGNEDTRRVGFSVSFGNNTLSLKNPEHENLYSLVSRFAALSVREKDGAGICRETFGIEPSVTLDPTLLHDRYPELTGRLHPAHNIVCYGFISDPAFFRAVRELSRHMEKPVEILGKLRPIRGFRYHYAKSVEKWVRAIAQSDLVLTDSFHGIAFSILYEKDFVAFVSNRKRSGRILSLLEALGLEDRLYAAEEFDTDTIEKIATKHIDYKTITPQLMHLRRQSVNFLKEALGEFD